MPSPSAPSSNQDEPAVPGVTGDIADPAGFWRRLAGFVVDWLLCFALPSLLSSLILLVTGYSSRAEVVDLLWLLFLAVTISGYFTYFAMRGPSPGMRLSGIKILDQQTGKPPGFARAFTRGILMLLLIGSWFIVMLFGSDGRSAGLTNIEAF
ncbi:MAG TPA: RDD family protein, partial [Nitrolancea sp.]|nr:RDD family protein [Nitrolancea sp.]